MNGNEFEKGNGSKRMRYRAVAERVGISSMSGSFVENEQSTDRDAMMFSGYIDIRFVEAC